MASARSADSLMCCNPSAEEYTAPILLKGCSVNIPSYHSNEGSVKRRHTFISTGYSQTFLNQLLWGFQNLQPTFTSG